MAGTYDGANPAAQGYFLSFFTSQHAEVLVTWKGELKDHNGAAGFCQQQYSQISP